MISERLSAALSCGERGWAVHPLNGKQPILKEWPNRGTIDDLAARVQVLERDVGTMRGILWPRDLWTLSTGERVLAFVGAGCLLLACSLMYHRFRDMILEAVSQ